MPYEHINHPTPVEPDADAAIPQSGVTWPHPQLTVHWQREDAGGPGVVELSLDCPRAYLEDLARTLDAAPDLDSLRVFLSPVSRADVNTLIRTVRRARDAAYGRDE